MSHSHFRQHWHLIELHILIYIYIYIPHIYALVWCVAHTHTMHRKGAGNMLFIFVGYQSCLRYYALYINKDD